MQGTSGELSPLSVLGFSTAQEELYRVLLRNSGSTLAEIADLVAALPLEAIREEVRRLAALGLVSLRGETVVALPPAEALRRLIDEETQRLESVGEQLESLSRLLPALNAEHLTSQAPRGEPVTVEVLAADDVVDLIRTQWRTASGDMLWLRPDQWRNPLIAAVSDAWVRELVRSGRRSRAIYPARVLEEAPDVVRLRADAGEHVRILADMPLRMAVLGDDAAIIGRREDDSGEGALVLRHELMIRSLRLLFETLWDKAMAVPGLDGQDREGASDRALLLDQLAGGAKDEQIARALGLSLRTVRRRVADLLDELGAESRFQAGVEAVRRGWV
jgi:DNA-binding Lrp family transcriptional regulator